MDATYTSLIQQYLSLMLYDNATFLSERYVSSSPSLHSNYLLATCYYKSGYPNKAMYILQHLSSCSFDSKEDGYNDGNSDSESNKKSNLKEKRKIINACNYLLAKCYYDLEYYKEAEESLLSSSSWSSATSTTTAMKDKKHNKMILQKIRQQLKEEEEEGQKDASNKQQEELEDLNSIVPNGAAGFYVLGCICRKTCRMKQAQDYFRISLKLDPLMWVSYEALCEMGLDIDPTSVFGVLPNQCTTYSTNADEDGSNVDVDVDDGGYAFSNGHTAQQQQAATVGGGRTRMEESCTENLERGCPSFLLSSPTASSLNNNHTTSAESEVEFSHTTHNPNGGLLSMVDMSYSTPPNAVASSRKGGSPTREPRHPPPLSRLRHSSTKFYTPDLTPIAKPAGDTTSNRSRIRGGNSRKASTARTRTSPYIVARASTVVSRLYYEPNPECSLPSLQSMATTATTSHDVCHSLAASEGNAIAESTAAFDVSGCGSEIAEIGAFFTNLGTTSTNVASAYISKQSGRLIKQPDATRQPLHHHGGLLASIHKQPFMNTYQDNAITTANTVIQELLTILCTLGTAILHLSQYRCKDSIAAFHTLPSHHFHTGYIQHQIGKAYFELADYTNAKQTLLYMSQLEPHRIQGLDLLSTALWHLKAEVDLCHLAQRVAHMDKLSPQTWIVVGNCFSLQKEHETALLFFKRSIQLDPSFTYAHTLSGHEYVSNEDLDRAALSFRHSIRLDVRHYNAWFGLGNIYCRQEKYDLATYHFQKALSIHPDSTILLCYLAIAQYSNNQIQAALQTLDTAIHNSTNNTTNPQARFQRATIYMNLRRYHEALLELEMVRDIAPREASIYFLMGKVHKKLNSIDKAMRCFLLALDLDPKDNNLIKSHMDRLDFNGIGFAAAGEDEDEEDDGCVSTL